MYVQSSIQLTTNHEFNGYAIYKYLDFRPLQTIFVTERETSFDLFKNRYCLLFAC